ncbi:O-fucosyltransferase family protein [Allorhizobium undicola]|uniref:O-fucosyltransferase family protein n=1 Tax=Allorhizobium undicola TaxID=78527 RepID=UPI000486A52C|nr:O-fucosyltransferase family protein [Allorhizobium undicola]
MKNVFGVEKITGGLNNQKMSILGLIVEAKKYDGIVNIPDIIHDWTPTVEGRGTNFIKTNEVYAMDELEEIIQITNEIAGTILSFSDCFASGSKKIKEEGGLPPEELMCNETARILSALKPVANIQCEINRLVGEMPKGTAGVQLRVERDWKNHLNSRRSRGIKLDSGRELILNPRRIFEKIRNNDKDGEITTLFLCCDEDDLMHKKSEISDMAGKFGLSVIFKSEISTAFLDSRLKRSLVDFGICLKLDTYIGLSLSTFSNLLCLTKSFEIKGKPNHFIYDAPGDVTVARNDFGRFHSPAEIVR